MRTWPLSTFATRDRQQRGLASLLTASEPVGYVAVLLLLTVFALAGYWRVLPTYFLAEDFLLIGGVTDASGAPNWSLWAQHLSSRQYVESFRPLVTLAYTVLYWLWGANPIGFRATALLIHIMNAFSVYLIVARVGPSRSLLAPLFAALLFVTHPAHPEAVTYIAALAGPLCALFSLSAIVLFLRYLDSRRIVWLAISLASLVLALGAKEEAVTVPLMVALLAWIRLWPSRARAGTSVTPIVLSVGSYFAVLGAYFGWRRYIFGYFTSEFHSALDAPLISVLDGVAKYLATLVAAVNRSYLGEAGQEVFVAVLSVQVAMLAALLIINRPPPILIACLIACLGVLLLPFHKVIAFGIDPALTNSRYLYLPSAAFAAGLALIAIRDGGRRFRAAIGPGALAAVVVLQLVLLNVNNQAWAKAGTVSRYMQQEALRLTGNNSFVEIANLPDTIDGVLFNRGGFQHSLREPFTAGNAVNRRRRIVTLAGVGPEPAAGSLSAEGFTWRVLDGDGDRRLAIDFAPTQARPYAAELAVPNPGCPAHPRHLQLRGRGTDLPPYSSYLAAWILPLAAPPIPGEPLSFIMSVSDVPDGVPAADVGIRLEQGAPWRFVYHGLDEYGHAAPPNMPITIPDGAHEIFRLDLYPIGKSAPSLLIPRISGVNTPTVMVTEHTTVSVPALAPAANPVPTEAIQPDRAADGRSGADASGPPCVLDFGTVPTAWYPMRVDRPYIGFTDEPDQLLWDDASGRLVAWEDVERARRLLRLNSADLSRWQRSSDLSYILVSARISALHPMATGQFFHSGEVDFDPREAVYLVVRMRSWYVTFNYARLWWKGRAEEPDDLAKSAMLLVMPDARWHTYAIPLHSNRGWTSAGRVGYLRFEPVMSSGWVEIERFEIIGHVP